MINRRHSERGFGILAVMVIVVMVGGIASAFLLLSTNEARFTDEARNKAKAIYLAEAGAEDAAFQVRTATANNQAVPAAGNVVINGSNVAYTIAQIAGSYRVEAGATGLQTTFYQYEIVATSLFNNIPGRVIRTVDAGATPIFQFLAFYNGDLEYLPGPISTVHGRIHTNRDLYLGDGAASTATGLQIYSDRVRAAGQMYRHRKDNGATMTGKVSVEKTGAPGTLVDWPSTTESTGAGWATAAATNWGGTVKNGVSPMEAPSLGSIQPGGSFESNAGLVIKDSSAYVGGVDVTASLPAGTIATTSIYDAREGKSVPVTTVDMAKLKTSTQWPANGLIYAYKTANTSTTQKGIHLKNGSDLASGLTVVSNGPVYVQGDYNTGGGVAANKKPAAIIADAVNLLSNAWTNTKTSTSGLPAALDTTYNCAMISGNQDTTSGQYNGGLENLPRFHENWTGKNCNIKGSFVNLYTSQIATGKWVYGGNKYTAPNRNWDYDTDFNTPSKLPPFTPLAISIGRTTYEEGFRN